MLKRMSWFYLALLAPFLYAIVNLLDDNLLRNVYKTPYIGTIVSGLFAGLPLLILPFITLPYMATNLMWLAILTGILNVLFLYFYFVSLGEGSPSTVVAVLGLAPAFLPFLAAIFLNEQLAHLQLLGLALVVFASIGLTFNRRDTSFKALRPLLTASAILCVNSLLLKYTFDRADFLSVYLLFSLGMMMGGGLFIALLLAKQDRATLGSLKQATRKFFLLFFVTELVGISAEFVLNLAISRGPVSAVRIIENIQPVYVLLIALALFPFYPKLFREAGEGRLVKKFSLMAVIIVGLALVEIAG